MTCLREGGGTWGGIWGGWRRTIRVLVAGVYWVNRVVGGGRGSINSPAERNAIG